MGFRIVIIISLVVLGCRNSDKGTQEDQSGKSTTDTSAKISHAIGEVLSPEARKLIDNWQEYATVETIMGEYYNISVSDAIANAKRLSDATQQLKDSIRVDRFKEPDLKIRLNILNNIALRLNDINQIPEIDDKEIEEEVTNLIDVFTSITSKLNNTLNQEALEKDLKTF